MKIIFTEDSDLPAGHQFDRVFSCPLLRRVDKDSSSNSWNEDVALAFGLVDETFNKYLNEKGRALLENSSNDPELARVISSLISSSLVIEKSNVHKSPYMDSVFLSAWIATQINKLPRQNGETFDFYLPSEKIASGVQHFLMDDFSDSRFHILEQNVFRSPRTGFKSLRFFGYLLKVLIWFLMQFLVNFSPKNPGRTAIFAAGGVLWLDYFFGRIPTPRGGGLSKYWNRVPLELEKSCGFEANFAHVFVPEKGTRYLRQARESGLLSSGTSLLTQELLRPRDFFSALRSLVLVYSSWTKSKAIDDQFGKGRHSWIIQAVEDDLAKSLFGTIAGSNLLFDISFKRLAEKCKDANLVGVAYVCEFQGWESLLLRHLEKAGLHSIGYCHSTVRPLDLRGWKVGESLMDDFQPQTPTLVAAHSKLDREILTGKNPKLHIVEVESCRYGNLIIEKSRFEKQVPTRVLMVGSYSDLETENMLSICNDARHLTHRNASFSYLPHPNSRASCRDFPYAVRPEGSTFSELLGGFDAVVAAAETSAAMEALLKGLPLIVVPIPGRLNASPLANFSSVSAVTTPIDLAMSLDNPRKPDPRELAKLAPFAAEAGEYPRWVAALTKLRP